jgi:hypothetical protein
MADVEIRKHWMVSRTLLERARRALPDGCEQRCVTQVRIDFNDGGFRICSDLSGVRSALRFTHNRVPAVRVKDHRFV